MKRVKERPTHDIENHVVTPLPPFFFLFFRSIQNPLGYIHITRQGHYNNDTDRKDEVSNPFQSVPFIQCLIQELAQRTRKNADRLVCYFLDQGEYLRGNLKHGETDPKTRSQERRIRF